MALNAAPGAFKIPLPCIHVPSLQIGSIHALAPARPVRCILLLRMNKRHERRDLLIRSIEGWHPLLRTPTAHHCPNFFSANISAHQPRARKVRPALTSRRIASVTEAAVPLEKHASLLHQLGRE